jgi:hypothetical protein
MARTLIQLFFNIAKGTQYEDEYISSRPASDEIFQSLSSHYSLGMLMRFYLDHRKQAIITLIPKLRRGSKR